MLKDSQAPRYSVPRTRPYAPQFKSELIAACLQPGASIAATAREHGMNANVLHRRLREHRLGLHHPVPERIAHLYSELHKSNPQSKTATFL